MEVFPHATLELDYSTRKVSGEGTIKKVTSSSEGQLRSAYLSFVGALDPARPNKVLITLTSGLWELATQIGFEGVKSRVERTRSCLLLEMGLTLGPVSIQASRRPAVAGEVERYYIRTPFSFDFGGTVRGLGTEKIFIHGSFHSRDEPLIIGEDPIAGSPGGWADSINRVPYLRRGYIVEDWIDIALRKLDLIVRANAEKALLDGDVSAAIGETSEGRALWRELAKSISLDELTKILRVLLREEISIRDMARILRSIQAALRMTRNAEEIAEAARHDLEGEIIAPLTRATGKIHYFDLSEYWDQYLIARLVDLQGVRQIKMRPEDRQAFKRALHEARASNELMMVNKYALVVSPRLRPYMHALAEGTAIISTEELSRSAEPKEHLGTVNEPFSEGLSAITHYGKYSVHAS